MKLTSAELSSIWITYLNYSSLLCLLSHFEKNVEDEDAKNVILKAKEITSDHLGKIENIFIKEKIVKPIAFPVEEHVNFSAPRLFSDLFYFKYLLNTVKVQLFNHATAVAASTRFDIHKLFISFLKDSTKYDEMIKKIMLNKGIYIREPYVDYPEESGYITKQSFLSGMVRKKRPLLVIELVNLWADYVNNEIGKDTLIAFLQVTKDEKNKKYYLRGLKIAEEVMKDIKEKLEESNISISFLWDTPITNSRESPFSEKLMLHLFCQASALSLTAYGTAMSTNLRHDLGAMYAKFLAEAAVYAEDGVNLMIERKWLEKMPMCTDHMSLIKEKNPS